MLTDYSVVRLPTSWPSGSSTLAFCSTHRMQTHKHILGRRAGYSAQRHHSTSFCRLTSLQKARSPCGAAYPVGRQGSRQPQKAPIGKILQQSTYAFASFPRTAKQQKLFCAGGVKGRRLAGTEKQAVCCLIYSFVMHIKFDIRSSALPYNWIEKRKCFAIRDVQAEASGEYVGQSPPLRKVQHLTRRCPLPKRRLFRQSVLPRKTPFCGSSFPKHKGKEKRECCRK